MTENTLCPISTSLKKALAKEFDARYRLGSRISWEPFVGQWARYLDSEIPTAPSVRSILFNEKKTSCELRIIDGLCQLLLGCSYEAWKAPHIHKLTNVVRRYKLEKETENIIIEPGSLLRIKSPASMGKNLFINNVLNELNKKRYTVVKYNCLEVDQECLKDYNVFLKNFCCCLIEKLNLSEELLSLSKWRSTIVPNRNLTRYFEKVFFSEKKNDLILVISNFDLLLENENINTNICRLFRSWYEKARQGDTNSEMWQRFHIIILHSTEFYAELNIHTSPLANVGKTVELAEFNLQEIKDLSQQYNLALKTEDIQKLMNFVGGHPLLINLAFQYLNNHRDNNLQTDLDFIFNTAMEETGIYANHLRKLLAILKNNSSLKEIFQLMLLTTESLEINAPIISWQLYSLGLIKRLDNHQLTVSCLLYRQYFKQNL
ncbi:MAG: hypothetical protein F6K10_19965 [Moorea sp. SIO2B7]|nr:hypothetical protein [Moorena sp. SIO2B7]